MAVLGTRRGDSLVGSAADDDIFGLRGNDTLLGNHGSDWLHGGEEADALFGGAGNDTFIYDAADQLIDGGDGIDTLKVTRAGVTVDLTLAPDGVIQEMEVIRLSGAGDNTLVLVASDLLSLSSTSHTLRVKGDAGDSVLTSDALWTRMPNVVIGAHTYAQYTSGTATLQVDTDIDRSAIDTPGSTIGLSALDGTDGFRIDGIRLGEGSGYSVASAGDTNGDGFDDVIIGAPGIGDLGVSRSYMVFGNGEGFASSIDLASLDGTQGFRISEAAPEDKSGVSVAPAGDVNGDGFADVIIGAFGADPRGEGSAGESYVVFGKMGAFSHVNLRTLDGANGFRVEGVDFTDLSGRSVASAGDINGDGFDDLVIGAPWADPVGRSFAGESYVVFGKGGGFAPSLHLSRLDGADGFRIDGVDAHDHSGVAVSGAGDINADGFDDLVIGATSADAASGEDAGESYVVFGTAAGFGPRLDLAGLNGSTGFRVEGAGGGDHSGSVGAAGDVNGDGFGDFVIGASFASESYVIFGKASEFASSLELASLHARDGFRIDGTKAGDRSGHSVAGAGDVNGDGLDDLIVGAFAADVGTETNAGASYVVFGRKEGFASRLDLEHLDGRNGFRIDGIDSGDVSGFSVASAGDVNGDGFDDVVIGAPDADPFDTPYAGESYVVYGRDFTGSVTHLGTGSADSFAGTGVAEIFVSGQADDIIQSCSRGDVVRAGAGDDRIMVWNTLFDDVNGGSGFDTLRIVGAGRTLDFTALANSKVTDIERINLTGSGENMLEIAATDLLDLSSTTNTLHVKGNHGDAVTLSGAWNYGGMFGFYHAYIQGAATILIHHDVFVA